ncbi:MAG: type I secretion system permease/ATPase [Proteobacteria bacterium]|nr:type I secretion system permease/ATPase [Pseudomonadota bacterium]MBU4295743.1 type I secretion system permease/ATPase [Pseudomonadota bacterium]MCG2747162.1 type I secretion system permease/ATPase [Desulfobulbaceae bacterium]
MKKFLILWKKYFVFAAVFSMFINLLHLTFPIYMLSIYDRVLTSYSMPTLMTITAGALFAYLVFACLDFLRSRLLVRAGIAIDETLSDTVLNEMLKDASRLIKTGSGSGLRDVNSLRNYFAGNTIFSLFDLPWAPIYLIIIFFMNTTLGTVALGGAVAIIILGISQEKLTKKGLDEANKKNMDVQRFINSTMRNAEVTRCMGMLSGIRERWHLKNRAVIQQQTKASHDAGMISSMTKTLRMSMQVFIYGIGAYLVLKNESTPGIMIAASIIMGRALAPVEQVMATWKQTIEVRGSYQRLDQLLQRAEKDEYMELPAPKGALSVENALLVIDGTRRLLNGVTFSLNAGESMGLIGPSAAGKSTLCRVLMGIWPAMHGTVRLDGADIFQWDKERLGPYIGYLPQDVELFPGTVSENIARMGNVDPDKVVEAAKNAGVHEMILRLPQGYNTEIGEMGQMLSGGQRQRIGLARAIYGLPKFVILDEPNSNLDDVGEQGLLRALQILKENCSTVIMVTHKISMLANMDKILLLKDGAVAMFGLRDDVFKALAPQQSPPPQKKITQTRTVPVV